LVDELNVVVVAVVVAEVVVVDSNDKGELEAGPGEGNTRRECKKVVVSKSELSSI